MHAGAGIQTSVWNNDVFAGGMLNALTIKVAVTWMPRECCRISIGYVKLGLLLRHLRAKKLITCWYFLNEKYLSNTLCVLVVVAFVLGQGPTTTEILGLNKVCILERKYRLVESFNVIWDHWKI